MRRLAQIGAAAALVTFLGGLGQAAQASTPGCVSNGFCGTQQHHGDGLVVDVFHASATVGNKLISFPNGDDRATDFINYHPASGPAANISGAKAFAYAPNGNPSGLCLSDPGPGFGTADLIVLRPCNNSKFQVWVPTASESVDGYFSWGNLASHQFLTSNGLRAQLTDVKDGTVGDPSNNVPDGRDSQLWKFVQLPAAA